MPLASTNETPTLYDQRANRRFTLDYPGLTTQDLLDFCDYFKVTFGSLEALSTPPAGLGKHDMFRVATNDYPARGLDVTFRSVVSWVNCRKTGYRTPIEGDLVELEGYGRVRVLCSAIALNPDDGGKLVVFTLADGMPRYLSAERFTGVSYDRVTDTYRSNAVLVKE